MGINKSASKITVVDSNVVNHWLMTGVINIPTTILSTTLIFNSVGPSTNVSYFHYRSGLVSCCFTDSTCHQPVMAASSLQELGAMRNLSTCELDKRRHLVTDVRTSNRYMD